MMRRRRNQRNARRGITSLGDPRINLFAGQVAAFTRLCPLRHLDLNLIRTAQISARHAEAAGCHLLDCAVLLRAEARGVFPALAGIGLAAEAVHRNRHAGVRFFRDGAVGHCTGLEALDDLTCGFNLLRRHTAVLRPGKAEQAAQRVRLLFVVDARRVLQIARIRAAVRCLAQGHDGLRIVHVILRIPAGAQLVRARAVQRGVHAEAKRVECMVMPPLYALGDLLEADAADRADRVGEILVDGGLRNADRLENLRRLIGLQRRNAHLGRNLDDAVQNGIVVVLDGGVIVLIQSAAFNALGDAFLRKIRVDRPRAVAEQRGKVMHIARLGALQNDGDRRALLCADQILLDGRDGKQRRYGDMVFIHAAVGQNDDVCAVAIGAVALDKKLVQRLFQRRILIVQERNGLHLEAGPLHMPDLHQLHRGQNRIADFKHRAVFRFFDQQIAVRADVHGRIGDDLLAKRVDRRIGNLCKQLLEIVEQRLMLLGQNRKRHVDAHGGRRFRAVFRHRQYRVGHVLVGVAECLIQPAALRLCVLRHTDIGHGQ